MVWSRWLNYQCGMNNAEDLISEQVPAWDPGFFPLPFSHPKWATWHKIQSKFESYLISSIGFITRLVLHSVIKAAHNIILDWTNGIALRSLWRLSAECQWLMNPICLSWLSLLLPPFCPVTNPLARIFISLFRWEISLWERHSSIRRQFI